MVDGPLFKKARCRRASSLCPCGFSRLKYQFYGDDSEIQLWTNSNRLKLNPSKSEFMALSSTAMRKRLEPLLPTHIYFDRGFKATK